MDSLSETMRALLYLSHETVGKNGMETTRVDLLLPELLQNHAHLLEFKPARFVLLECTTTAIHAPQVMVSIVIANLLRNAAEHTQRGDIAVSLNSRRFRVADSGDGFDPVEAARSYSASFQKSMKPGGGHGLGLFLIRRICERFQWTLTLSSALNKGSEVEIRFSPSD